MARSSEDDWYFRDWMQHFGKKQAALVNELGWDKAKANFIWHSKQPYRRDLVNELAAWLGVRAYELLMPVDEAMALRRLRETAYAIAAEDAANFEGPSPPAEKRARGASRS